MNEALALRYIFSRLAGGQNIALIAPIGSDRTELLYHIGEPNIYSRWLPRTSQWVFDYLTAVQFKSGDTATDFWQRVWQSFADRAVGQPWHSLVDELTNGFVPRSDRILRRLDRYQARLVLLLDDLDKMVDKPRLFTPELLGPLRSLSSRHLSFTVVFTSELRLSELNRQVEMSGSPPFNNFNEVLLSEFVEAEAG